jgi:hypothetical protein
MVYFLGHQSLTDEEAQVLALRLRLDLTFEVDEPRWADWMRNGMSAIKSGGRGTV